MAHIVGKDYTQQKIMAILMDLIKDENSDVRLGVVTGMIKLSSVMGPDLLQFNNFLSTMNNMTKDAQWRVRMAIIELIGDLSKYFGKDVFCKHLEPIFMTYLVNTAASVREMGILKSGELAEKFKADWLLSSFVPKVIENYNIDKQGYNYRMCSLKSLAIVMPQIPKDQITSQFIPLFMKALKDPIPNVRFCCAKILHEHKKIIDVGIFSS